MPRHSFNYFQVEKYYQNESKFNGIHSINNLPKIKDGTYGINLEEYKLTEIHWIALYVNGDSITYLLALEFNIFQKRLKYLWVTEISQQIFLEYKHAI